MFVILYGTIAWLNIHTYIFRKLTSGLKFTIFNGHELGYLDTHNIFRKSTNGLH